MTTSTEETTWTFDIPECNVRSLRAKLAKLVRRALKLGVVAPVLTEDEPRDVVLLDERGRRFIRRYVRVTVEQAVPVAFSGWSFAASIDHGSDDAGNALNVIRTSPHFEGDVPKSFRTDGPTCDHCRTVRRRNETFVVYHADGELRRVGRQCLRDFLGHTDARNIVARASFLRDLRCALDDAEQSGGFGGGIWRVGALDALTWTAFVIRTNGWLSRGKSRDFGGFATADLAWDLATLACGLREPGKGETLPESTEQDATDASEALEWARAIDPDTDSDYLHNLRVVLSRSSVSAKEIGLAASAVAVYIRERDRTIAQQTRISKPSNWLGTVGQRFGGKGKTGIPAIDGNIIKAHGFEGAYGLTTIFVVQTDEGDEVLWFASGSGGGAQVGERVTINGTIKAHKTDRDGRKQTQISRGRLDVRPNLDSQFEASQRDLR